jgi:hypothetical protein
LDNGRYVEEGEQSFSNMGGDAAKFSMEEAKHNYWLYMINNLPTTWVEEFKAPFQQTKSTFVNGSIHNWGAQKKIRPLSISETTF